MQKTAALSIVAALIRDSLFLMNFKCLPVNTLQGEKISIKASVPIVAQTKQKKKTHYLTQKVKQYTLHTMP